MRALPILAFLVVLSACRSGGDRSSAGGFSAELGIDTAAMTKTPNGLQYQDVKVGHAIPIELYEVFVEIMAYVYRLSGKAPPNVD